MIRRACLGAAAVFCGLQLHGASITLGWDPSSDTNVAGYHLYYGVSGHNYTRMADAGAATSATLSNLVPGVTYYMAGTTYDAIGAESAFSQELSFAVSVPSGPLSNVLSAVNGTYSGLFSEPDQVRQQSAGAFTLTVSSRGAFTGRVQVGGIRLGFSGKLDSTGQARKSLPRRTGALNLQLALDAQNQPATASGLLSDSTWTATAVGRRAVFDSRTNPAPFAGSYTLAILGQAGSPDIPAGAGCAVVRIARNGQTALAGTLADGIKFRQTTSVSEDGWLPVYVPLYGGNGSLWSWLTCSNGTLTNVQGQVAWTKPANEHAHCYPSGFAAQFEATGCRYQPPAANSVEILDVTSASLAFSGGTLPVMFSDTLQVTPSGVWRSNGGTDATLLVSRGTGLFRGVVNTPDSGKFVAFRGVLLQGLSSGFGYMLYSGQSSDVELSPAVP